MATVIDSLFIELGLDTTKFDAAQKKSIEQLRKFDTQSQKAQKNTQAETKKTSEGFNKATDSLIAFGTAFVGISAFTSFVSGMTSTNAALSRNSSLFSMSAHELDAWGGVLKSVGGDASNFQSSIQGIQSGLANIKLGDTAILTPLARLGALDAIDVNKNTVDVYKLADSLKAFKAVYGEQTAFSLAQQIGLDKSTFMVLQQGADAVHKLYDASSQHSKVTDENTAAAAKLQSKMGDVENAFGGVKNKIMDQMYPSLMSLASGIESVIDKTVEWDEDLGGLFSKTSALSGTLLALAGVMRVLSIIPGPIGFAAKLASVGLAAAGVGTAVVGGGAGVATEVLLSKPTKDKAKELMDYYKSQGVDEEHAAALVGNFMQESSLNPKSSSKYKGQSYVGLGQWGEERQSDYEKWSGGKKLSEATAKEQAAFSLYELKEGKEKEAGNKFFAEKGIENLANIISSKYERPNEDAANVTARVEYSKAALESYNKPSEIKITPKVTPLEKNDDKGLWDKLMDIVDPKGFGNSERNKEYNMAHDFKSPMIGSNVTAPRNNNTSNSTNIQTNNVTVHTQATDAKGIVRELPRALEDNSIRMNGMVGNN